MTLSRADRYTEFKNRRLRGQILIVLAEIPGEQSSSAGLHVIIADEAVDAGRDRIEEQMRWLGERGYVSASIRGEELVAAITDRGSDIVARREADAAIDLPRRKVD